MNDNDKNKLEKIADDVHAIGERLPIMESDRGTMAIVNIEGWLEQLEEKIRSL